MGSVSFGFSINTGKGAAEKAANNNAPVPQRQIYNNQGQQFYPQQPQIFAQSPEFDNTTYRDKWAAVVYIVHLIIVGAVCLIFGLLSVFNNNDSQPDVFNANRWAPAVAIVILFAAIFSFAWILVVRWFPIRMIKIALWAGVGVNLVLGCLVLFSNRFRNHYGVGFGLLFILLAIIQAVYAYRVRFRVPFAAAMISKVIAVTAKFPTVYLVSYMGLGVSILWISLWSFGMAGAIRIAWGLRWMTAALLFISLAWTMEVIRNTVHVTAAGTIATFYFQQHNMPQDPTKHAFRRACTTSFGSICLGSLIVAIIEGIRWAVRSMSGYCNRFLLSCIGCILRFIEGLFRYFNRWAFVQVAVYGKPFVTAAKDTWILFRNNGCDVLVNDDLTKTVFIIGCTASGSLCALLGGLYTFFTDHHSDHKMNMSIAVASLSFFIGYYMTYLTTTVVLSGVTCYYVCFAENPAVLQQTDPEFYEILWMRQRELTTES